MRLTDLKAGASVALVLLGSIGQSNAQQQTPIPTQTPIPAQTQPQPPAQTQTQPPAQTQTQTSTETQTQTQGQNQSTQSQTNPTQAAAREPVQNDTTGNPALPQTPEPAPTQPLFLHDLSRDFLTLHRHHFRDPFAPYTPTDYPGPRLGNTGNIEDLVRDGKLYLSLSDAVTLALENNYDIAIARINLDIADTDVLRTQSGQVFRGVSTGLVTGTLGGTTTTIQGGGGPGGTNTASGGAGAGQNGLVLSTNGGGPLPYNFDPIITGTTEFERSTTQGTSTFNPTTTVGTITSNLAYQEGFKTGTLLNVGFNNTRTTSTSPLSSFTPLLNTNLRATVTQHLLQGFGPKLNRRFIIEAENDRRITDSSFRQQLIYTITQVESIYWSLVSAYEDEQAKERALNQSTQLSSDNRKQLEIGTLAPLDVVNSDSVVVTDKQALVTSQSNLEFQQLLIKQAIARNLNDPQLVNAPVVPTDRVGLERIPEEDTRVEDLVRQAYVNNPQVEQAVLSLRNNEITIRGEKNGLLPVIDAFGFYGVSAIGGTPNPNAVSLTGGGNGSGSNPPNTVPAGYPGLLQNLFVANNPDYGFGVNVNIPIRNRAAQADQARSQMEYRQTQMRLQQLYTQIRIQVINGQYALTNDRANVQAAQAARDFNAQSLEAEQKKYKLGASTTANVLAQERTLATGEDSLISATARYAQDRSALRQILSNTLDLYGISLVQAATGNIDQKPIIPGLTAPKAPAPPKPLSATPTPLPQ